MTHEVTTLREAAMMALEALEHVVRQAQENLVPTIHYGPVHDVMNNLRAALAQQAEPVQEPVAWLYEAGADRTLHWYKPPLCGTPLYTAPPQRKPLTDEEIRRICDAHWSLRQLARAIERAHGIGVQS